MCLHFCPHLTSRGKYDCILTVVIKIYFISIVYYVCPCLGQQVRETVEILFVICFVPFFTFKRRPCLWRCGCLWKLTGNLARGANADPKLAGQTSAHTPAFVAGCLRRCQTQWCGERLQESSELATRKSWHSQRHMQGHRFIDQKTHKIWLKGSTHTQQQQQQSSPINPIHV